MAAGLPDSPALHSCRDKETLIKSYFKEGYTYSEICSFLELRHRILLTIDQLRGRLKKLNLKRRDEIQTPLEVVSAAIMVTNLITIFSHCQIVRCYPSADTFNQPFYTLRRE